MVREGGSEYAEHLSNFDTLITFEESERILPRL